MTKAPNQTVTRAQLDALEAGRAKPRETLDYTIGGATEKAVHEQTEEERNHALRTGHDRLRQASQSMQTAHVFYLYNKLVKQYNL